MNRHLKLTLLARILQEHPYRLPRKWGAWKNGFGPQLQGRFLAVIVTERYQRGHGDPFGWDDVGFLRRCGSNWRHDPGTHRHYRRRGGTVDRWAVHGHTEHSE